MHQEHYFPTFKEWLRAVAAPNRRVRYKLKKKARSTRPAVEASQEEGEGFTLAGLLKPGQDTKYAINGSDFVIDEKTEIAGELAYGKHATIEGKFRAAGLRYAATMKIAK